MTNGTGRRRQERSGRICEACAVCSQTRREEGREKGTRVLDNDSKPRWVLRVCLLSPRFTRPDHPSPAPFPCTLCLDWEGNERKSRTHILPIAVSSQRYVSGAESFSSPLQEGLLLCWLQIKSFHLGTETPPALSLLLLLHRELSVHVEKNTLHRIHLPVTQPSTDSRSQKHLERARKAAKQGAQALGSPRLGAT